MKRCFRTVKAEPKYQKDITYFGPCTRYRLLF